MKHLMAFRKSHPNMDLTEAMQAAKKTYKRHDIMDKKHDAERDKEHKKANTSRRYKGKYGAGAVTDPLGSEPAATPLAASDNATAVGASRKGKKAKTMKRAGRKAKTMKKH